MWTVFKRNICNAAWQTMSRAFGIVKKVKHTKSAFLNVILPWRYEDFALGDITRDRYRKISADYKEEQERLRLEIDVIEERWNSGKKWTRA